MGMLAWVVECVDNVARMIVDGEVLIDCADKLAFGCLLRLSLAVFCTALLIILIVTWVNGDCVQGDTSGCDEPPVDFITKVPFWPGLSWPGQAKTELLFWSQREVRHNHMCHPVTCYSVLIVGQKTFKEPVGGLSAIDRWNQSSNSKVMASFTTMR